MRAQGTPAPITSDSEVESVVAKELEFCEICGKWGGPFRQCNFCGDRPSRHHGRCCEHNPDNRYPPSGDDYPTPPTPTPVVWHVSSHHSNDDVEFADVDMRGKRKRTIEESEVEEVPVVQAMDNWVQSTKPRGATQLFDEVARSDDSTAIQCEGQGQTFH